MSYTASTTAPLLDILQTFAPDSSKTTLKKWIKARRVFVNDQVIEDATKIVQKGSTLTLGARKEYFKANIEILYEDQEIVVIYKPHGLLSVATEKEPFYTAHHLLKSRRSNGQVYPVHRLDRETSGILVFAYNPQAKEHLKSQFMDHSIHREYRALLLGHLEEKKGTWQSYLKETPSYHVYECPPSPDAMLAITEFEVLQETKKLSFVKFVLKTGKKNQIRVQAAHRGHPVVGDKKYGSSSSSPCEHISLHAYALEFTHPTTSKKMHFSYPYPTEFQRLLPQKNRSKKPDSAIVT